jgi:hypothetical protein
VLKDLKVHKVDKDFKVPKEVQVPKVTRDLKE